MIYDIPTLIKKAEERRWISVEEELPKNEGIYLAYDPIRKEIGTYFWDPEWAFEWKAFSHWAKLPEPPSVSIEIAKKEREPTEGNL